MKNIVVLLSKEIKNISLIVWFYICGIGLLTIFLTIITPPLKGIDEAVHFLRALQVSEGQFFSTKYQDNTYGGDLSKKMSSYALYATSHKVIDRDVIDGLEQIPEKEKERQVFPTSATYSPIMYIPLASGVWIGKEIKLSIHGRYVMGKIFNIICYIGFVLLIFSILPYGKYFALLFLTAPAVFSMAAYYNADTFVNLFVVLFIACCLRSQVVYEKNNILKYIIFILAISLGLLKITYCFFSLLVLLLPFRLFKRKLYYYIFVIMSISSSVLLALIWNSFYKFTPGAVFHTHNDPAVSIQMLIHHPLIILKLVLHTFYASLHTWSYDIYNRFVNVNGLVVIRDYSRELFFLILFLTFFIEEKIRIPLWKVGFQIVIGVVYSLIVFIAFYVGFSAADATVISGLQARYFILPMMLCGVAASCLIPNRYICSRMINPLLIINFLGNLYIVIMAAPQILS